MIELAVIAGTALVNALVTDGWEGVRAKVAHWFGRGDKKEADAALAQLDQSRAELAAAGAELEQARARQEIIWQTRMSDLLGRYPEAEKELPALIGELKATTIGSAHSIQQTATATGHAQQAVQGQGVQTNTFGGQGRGAGGSGGSG